MTQELHNLGYVIRYNFHTEMFRVYCMNCNEEILDTNRVSETGPSLYSALDIHTRKCYPESNKL